jgi:hypothetical protein
MDAKRCQEDAMFQDGNMVLDIKLETTKGLGISLVYISLVIKQHAHSSSISL